MTSKIFVNLATSGMFEFRLQLRMEEYHNVFESAAWRAVSQLEGGRIQLAVTRFLETKYSFSTFK